MKLPDIRKLCEEATPAPWRVHLPRAQWAEAQVLEKNGGLLLEHTSYWKARSDAAFIAASRTLLPKLLSIVDTLLVKKIEIIKDGIKKCDEHLAKMTDTGVIHKRAFWVSELEILEQILEALEAE